MPTPNDAAFEFLATRRSRPAKTFSGPAPDRSQLKELLQVASRVPDHGALVPWRFLVLEKEDMLRVAEAVDARARALELSDADREKSLLAWQASPLCVAVIHVPRSTEKIPAREQVLTGGANCLSLVNAALAKSWGANWISGWAAYDSVITAELGLKDAEAIAGFVHIGTETLTPPERPRPDVDNIITWGLS